MKNSDHPLLDGMVRPRNGTDLPGCRPTRRSLSVEASLGAASS